MLTALLVALLLLLIFYIVMRREGFMTAVGKPDDVLSGLLGGGSMDQKAPAPSSNSQNGVKCGGDPMDFGPAGRNSYNPQLSNGSYEAQAHAVMREQAEYFQTCTDSSETSQALSCICPEGGDNLFAKYEYGAPNMDYKEFVTSQAVDDQVIVNHANYIKDRKQFGVGGEMTGKTFSPDSHDSYNYMPWTGLRRPQGVARCNPTQMDGAEDSSFSRNRQFCFST